MQSAVKSDGNVIDAFAHTWCCTRQTFALGSFMKTFNETSKMETRAHRIESGGRFTCFISQQNSQHQRAAIFFPLTEREKG